MTNNSEYLRSIHHDHAILFSGLLSSNVLLMTLLKVKTSRDPSYLFTSPAALAASINPR